MRLLLFVPEDVLPGKPTVKLRLNGELLEEIVPTASAIERVYTVEPFADAVNQLVIETDRVVNPRAAGLADDPRDLGLRLDRLEWILIDVP